MKTTTLKKNEIYQVTIIDMTYEAYGVCKIEGMTVFVESVLPGEICEIRIERIERRFAFGKVLSILKESPDRVAITDKVGTRIGTMPLQHMAYQKQGEFKRRLVIDCFAKTFPLDPTLFNETLIMDNPWGYRNKAQIPVRMVKDQLETGFFKRNSHDLVPIENFHIQDPIIDQTILTIRDILRTYHVPAYDEATHHGIIRHVIVRRGQVSGEIMVILVTNDYELPHEHDIVKAIVDQVPGVVSIVQNCNLEKTNVIMGDFQKILHGDDVYNDTLLGKTYGISSKSFFQVNTKQTEVLYQCALDFAKIDKNDIVIDAYCGIGTITLSAADHAKHVYGVEIVEDAITRAKANAKRNHVENVTFEAGRAETIMKQWVDAGIHADVLIVDPPRKGLAQSFIKATLETKPKRIVYVSCNPVTLARDVRDIAKGGYTVEVVQPVDMFPHTTHVETVVRLTRKK